MGSYVDRDPTTHAVVTRYAERQRIGQEFLADADDIDAAREAKRAEIERAYAVCLAKGLSYGGKTLQIDQDSQAKISAIFARAVAVQQGVPGLTWPAEGFPWRMADNSYLTLDVAGFLAMAQAAADYCAQQFYARGTLKDQAAAAQTVAAVQAIDVASTWPT